MTPPPAASTAAQRLLSDDAGAAALDPLPLDPATVRAGAPEAALAELEDGDGAVGVWELGPGIVTDVEEDEVFVVLSGRGTVTFPDGSTIPLGPGTVVRLRAGDRTVWQVSETLRKVYVVPA
ncbi:cupin domain-containing protein [Blastococcus sp. SYSU D00820]